MRKEQCPWGYQYKGRARSVNRKHRCNVSCWERWTLAQCLEWLRVTPIHIRGAETVLPHLRHQALRGFATA
jgi:hypothetical protein